MTTDEHQDGPGYSTGAGSDFSADESAIGHHDVQDAQSWEEQHAIPADDFDDLKHDEIQEESAEAPVQKGKTGFLLLAFLGLLVAGAGGFAYMQFGMAGSSALPAVLSEAAPPPPEIAQTPPPETTVSLPTAEPPPPQAVPGALAQQPVPAMPAAASPEIKAAAAPSDSQLLPPVVQSGAPPVPSTPAEMPASLALHPVQAGALLPPANPQAQADGQLPSGMPAFPAPAGGEDQVAVVEAPVVLAHPVAAVETPAGAGMLPNIVPPQPDLSAVMTETVPPPSAVSVDIDKPVEQALTPGAIQNEKIALQKEVDDLRQTVRALNDKIAQMEIRKTSRTESGQSAASGDGVKVKKAQTKQAQSAKSAPKQSAVKTAKKSQSPSSRQASARKSGRHWILRAAVPGSAWVADSPSSTSLKPIKVGDTVPGLGKIKSIVNNNGRWIVKGSERDLQ